MNVHHDEAAQRFVIHFDEEDATLQYSLPGPRVIDLVHTYVPESARGHGAAEKLALAAFDYARANKLRVVPSCPFIRKWLSGHAELLELVDPEYAKAIERQTRR
jgi:predicted GNAT family acetyltransferase